MRGDNRQKNFAACPRCGRALPASGELVVDGVACAVYQCGRCIMDVEFGGEKVSVAVTFCVNENGHAIDPVTGRAIRKTRPAPPG